MPVLSAPHVSGLHPERRLAWPDLCLCLADGAGWPGGDGRQIWVGAPGCGIGSDQLGGKKTTAVPCVVSAQVSCGEILPGVITGYVQGRAQRRIAAGQWRGGCAWARRSSGSSRHGTGARERSEAANRAIAARNAQSFASSAEVFGLLTSDAGGRVCIRKQQQQRLNRTVGKRSRSHHLRRLCSNNPNNTLDRRHRRPNTSPTPTPIIAAAAALSPPPFLSPNQRPAALCIPSGT